MQSISITPQEKIQALGNNPYFEGLEAASLVEFCEHMSLRRFEKGEVLFWEGDPCAGLHIVHTGSLKLFRISLNGRQYIVRIAQEGDTCNEVSVFDGGFNPVNVEALEDSQVWVIEADAIRALMEKDPVFTQKVAKTLAKMMRNLIRMVSEMAFYQVTHRLARLISGLSEEELSGEGKLRLTQDQLAARLGTVREVVARSLKELERSGAITMKNRRIYISNPAVLEQWQHP